MRHIKTTLLAVLALVLFYPLAQAQQESVPDPNEAPKVEVWPAAQNMQEVGKNIRYPKELKEAGVQGKVYVKLLISEEGKVLKHIIVKSPHERLSAEVIEHVHFLEFTPGQEDGKAVMTWVMVPFDFKLKGDEDENQQDAEE